MKYLNQQFQVESEFIQNFIYLFLVDIDRLNPNDNYTDYESYESREPGYNNAVLAGFEYAYESNLNRKISGEFIKNLHKKVMGHFPEKNPGELKKTSNYFNLGYPIINGQKNIIKNYNVTLDGFKQFMNSWFLKKTNPIHFVHFKSLNKQIFILPVNYYNKESGTWIQTIVNGKLISIEKYQKHHEKIIKECFSNPSFECFINSTPTDIAPYLGYSKETIPVVVNQHMNEICDNYNNAIEQTLSDEEKMFVIIKHLQLIAQLHPFSDGNTRTIYLLLNRLLHEEKLPLSILINPNRLDCLSIEELYTLVIDGQKAYLNLCQKQLPVFTDIYSMELPVILPKQLMGLESGAMVLIDIINKNINNMNSFYLMDTDLNHHIINREIFYHEVNQTSTSLILNKELGLDFHNYQRPDRLVDSYCSLESREHIEEKIVFLKNKGISGHFAFFKNQLTLCVPSINSTEVASNIQKMG